MPKLPKKTGHKYCQDDQHRTGPNESNRVPSDCPFASLFRGRHDQIDHNTEQEQDCERKYSSKSRHYALEVNHAMPFAPPGYVSSRLEAYASESLCQFA